MNFKLLSLAVVGTIGAVTAVIYIARDDAPAPPQPQPKVPAPSPPPALPVVEPEAPAPVEAREPAPAPVSASELRARTTKARRDQRFVRTVLDRAKRKGFAQEHETPLGLATITEIAELLDEIDGRRPSSLDDDERRARLVALLNPPRTTH